MYESFYRLSTKPFGLNPDPDFIFTRRGHELAMAHLRYGISQSTGFVVITGAPGTGKTTLARVLLKELANNTTIVVAHLPSTHLAADDLLCVVADSFDLKYEGLSKPEVLKLLKDFLLSCIRERKRTLLVIDEAQNLTACALEELRLLANLRLGAKALLQTILLGQEQFRQMLNTQAFSQITQRVVANYHLVPLTLEEAQAYIESRLLHANWQGNPHFSDEAIFCIHEHTEGIPRRINKFCERLLLYGYLEEQTEISKEIVQVVINEFQQETPTSRRKLENIEIDEAAQSEALAAPYAIDATNITTETVQTSKIDEPTENHNVEMIAPDQEKNTLAEISTENLHAKTEETLPLIEDNDNFNELINTQEPAIHTSSDSKESNQVAQEKDTQEDKNEFILEEEPSIEEEILSTDRQSEQEAIASSQEAEELENGAVVMAHHSTQPLFNKNETTPTTSSKSRFRVIDGGKEKRSPSKPQFENDKSQPSSKKNIEKKLLKLVLAFQLSPKHFEQLTDPNKPPPDHAGQLLELATADDNIIETALPQSLQGISRKNLQTAINFYVWEVLLKPGGNHYRTLGLQNDASINEVKNNYQHLKTFLSNQKGEHKNRSEYLFRIEKAYVALTKETDEFPRLAAQSKQKSDIKADRIEEAYKILSEETIDPSEIVRPVFKKPASDNKSKTYITYLVFGLTAIAISIGIYKTQFSTHESEHSIAETESANQRPDKAILFDTKNSVAEKTEDTTKEGIDKKSTESTVEKQPNDLSLSANDPWKEDTGISNVQEFAEDQMEIIAAPAPQKETIPEVVETPKPSVAIDSYTAPAEELPLATLYSDEAPAKAATPNSIEKVDLINLISRFTTAYEQGEITQFMALFSIDATGFDGTTEADRNGIEADYIDLFKTTDARQIAIKEIKWDTENNISKGASEFVVTVKNINSDHFEFVSGLITFEVEKTQSGLFITRITYKLK